MTSNKRRKYYEKTRIIDYFIITTLATAIVIVLAFIIETWRWLKIKINRNENT